MQPRQPIALSTIIFDFDGTLADTHRSIVKAFWAAVAECQITCRRDPSVKELITVPLRDAFEIAGVFDRQLLYRATASYDRHFREIAAQVSLPFPGVTATLRMLRRAGFRLAIATNEYREILDRLLAAFEIDRLFDATVCADEVVLPKPAVDMIDVLLKSLGSRARNTLVVGDSTLDLQMGKAAGCLVCAVTYGAHSAGNLRQLEPDWLIDDFPQLLRLDPIAAVLDDGQSS